MNAACRSRPTEVVRSALTRATDRAPRATTWSTTRSIPTSLSTPTKADSSPSAWRSSHNWDARRQAAQRVAGPLRVGRDHDEAVDLAGHERPEPSRLAVDLPVRVRHEHLEAVRLELGLDELHDLAEERVADYGDDDAHRADRPLAQRTSDLVGLDPIRSATWVTRSTVSAEMRPRPVKAREAVVTDTPAAVATSFSLTDRMRQNLRCPRPVPTAPFASMTSAARCPRLSPGTDPGSGTRSAAQSHAINPWRRRWSSPR